MPNFFWTDHLALNVLLPMLVLLELLHQRSCINSLYVCVCVLCVVCCVLCVYLFVLCTLTRKQAHQSM